MQFSIFSISFILLTRVRWLAAVALVAQRVKRPASAVCDGAVTVTSPSSWLTDCVTNASLTGLVLPLCLFTAILWHLRGQAEQQMDQMWLTAACLHTHVSCVSTNLQPDILFFWAVAPHQCFHRAESVRIKGPDGLGQDKLLASSCVFNQTPLGKA